MNKTKILYCLCALSLFACGETRTIDLENKAEVSSMQGVMELEYRDWTKTAEKMTKSMLSSGSFYKIDKPVIVIGSVINDTMQRFDTDILIKKMRKTIINSGKAQITTSFKNKKTTVTEYMPVESELTTSSISDKKTTTLKAKSKDYVEVKKDQTTAEDETTHIVRNLRNNKEYNKDTITKEGTLIAPNLSLTGKMIQRNLGLKSGWFSTTDTRVEYYLQLTLTDLKTGLSVWEDEEPIIKEGDHAPNW